MARHTKTLKDKLLWLSQMIQSKHPRQHSPRLRWRRRIAASVMLIFLISVVSFTWYQLDNTQIRNLTIKIVEDLTGGEAEIEEISFNLLNQTRIKGLKLYLPQQQHTEDNLVFQANDVILQHDPSGLLKKQYRLTKIIAEQATLNIRYDSQSNTTNLQQLNFIDKNKTDRKSAPIIIIRNARVQYWQIQDGLATSPGHQNISGTVKPDPANQNCYSFNMHSASDGLLQGLELFGSYDKAAGQVQAELKMDISKIDCDQLPLSLQRWHQMYIAATPQGQLTVNSLYQRDKNIELTIKLADASYNLAAFDDQLNFPLENVNADIAIKNQIIHIKNIISDFGNNTKLSINGQINGLNKDSGFDLNIATENFAIPANQWDSQQGQILLNKDDDNALKRTLNSFLAMIPVKSRQEIISYNPSGKADVNLKITRQDQKETQSKIQSSGTITIYDMAFSYDKLPYPLEKAQGKIVFGNNKMHIGPISTVRVMPGGQKEVSAVLESDMSFGPQPSWSMTTTFMNLPTDKVLYDSLDPNLQNTWDNISPQGILSGVYKFSKITDKNNNFTKDFLLTLDFTDFKATLKDFPLPLTNMTGQFISHNDSLKLDNIIARAAGGQLKINAHVNQMESAMPDMYCQIDFKNVYFDKALADQLQNGIDKLQNQTGLETRLDGQAILKSIYDKDYRSDKSQNNAFAIIQKNMDLAVELNLADGKANLPAYPYPLSDIKGHCLFHNGEINIKEISAANGPSKININGNINGQGQLNMTLEADRLSLDENVTKLVHLDDQCSLAGKAKVTVKINSNASEQSLNYNAVIEPLQCALTLKKYDYTFGNIQGTATINNEQFDIANLNSFTDQGNISVKGKIKRNKQTKDPTADLQITTRNFRINDKLLDSVSTIEKLAIFKQELRPNGSIDCDLKLTKNDLPENNSLWKVQGQVHLNNMTLPEPASVDNLNCTLNDIDAVYNTASASTSFDAKMSETRLLLFDKPFNQLNSSLHFDNKTYFFNINNIDGQFCDGKIAGDIIAKFDDQKTYELDIRFLKCDIPTLMNAGKPLDQHLKNLKGRFEGKLKLSKSFIYKPEDFARGYCTLMIDKAELGQLPIIAELLNFVNLKLPKKGAFNDAEITGYIIDNKTILEKITLGGTAISLDGDGYIENWPFALINEKYEKLEDKIDLTFVIKPIELFEPIPVLTSFYKAIRQEMVRVYVKGNISKPQISSSAFPSILEALGGPQK
ncbi:MAG: hypothetical protein JEZ07_05685 [Phycisphaerae bacterium]|nr:hypothetical protein [Phycisphaerae bacterium]